MTQRLSQQGHARSWILRYAWNPTERNGTAGRLGASLFAFDAEVVDERSYLTVRVDSHMEVLMHQEIVSWPLTNDLEVAHKGGLEAYLAVERTLSLACTLILVASRQARAAHSLWLG